MQRSDSSGESGWRSLRAALRCEARGQLRVDGVDDLLLKTGRELLGTVVVDHRVGAFVSAFLEHALARDVTRRVIGVGDDGEARAVELAFEPERVVDDDFAGEKHDRELIGEAPCLDRVVDIHGQRFAAVESREIHTGVMADGVVALRTRLPLLARTRRVEGQVDAGILCGGRGGDLLERRGEQALYFIGDLPALVGGDLRGVARVGIGIRAAAGGHHGHRSGEVALDGILREAGPVAADEIIRKRHAMARVGEPDGAHFSIGLADDEKRQIVIDRAARCAAVFGEADAPDAPLDFGGANVFHRGEGDLFEVVGEFARVAVDLRLMIVGDRLSEERRRDAAQHRRGVRVRGGDGESLAAKAELGCETFRDFLRDGIGHAEVVGGDEDRRAVFFVGEGDRFRPDALREALGFRAPETESAQAHRVVGCDVHLRDADAQIGGERGERKREGREERAAAGGHCFSCFSMRTAASTSCSPLPAAQRALTTS